MTGSPKHLGDLLNSLLLLYYCCFSGFEPHPKLLRVYSHLCSGIIPGEFKRSAEVPEIKPDQAMQGKYPIRCTISPAPVHCLVVSNPDQLLPT